MTNTETSSGINRRTVLKNTVVAGGSVLAAKPVTASSGEEYGINLVEVGVRYEIDADDTAPLSTIVVCDPDKYTFHNGVAELDPEVVDPSELDVIREGRTVGYYRDFVPAGEPIRPGPAGYLTTQLSPKLQPEEAVELAEKYDQPPIYIEQNDDAVVVAIDDYEEKIEPGEELVQQFSMPPATVVTHEPTGELVETDRDIPEYRLARRTEIGTEEVEVELEVRARAYGNVSFYEPG